MDQNMANPLKQIFGALRKLIDKLVGRRTIIKKVEIIKEVPIVKEVIKEVEVPVEKIVEKKIYIKTDHKGWSWKKKSKYRWGKKKDDCDDKSDKGDKD